MFVHASQNLRLDGSMDFSLAPCSTLRPSAVLSTAPTRVTTADFHHGAYACSHHRSSPGLHAQQPGPPRVSVEPISAATTDLHHASPPRRSANFQASIWDADHIQFLTSRYKEGKYIVAAEKLKNEVIKIMLDKSTEELEQLELIDNLQRIGISRHFEDHIAKMLDNIYETDKCRDHNYTTANLHTTSLKFRLLRQHGYHVPQEVFCSFMDDEGNFKSSLSEDIQGLISMYNASYLSMEGESILDSAKDFSLRNLTQRLEQIIEPRLVEQVKHALEVPLHWRVGRLEAKWFVQFYETRSDANLTLLELAKLDFNMVQAMSQDELKRISRWYKETGLLEKLNFARHRNTECYLWSLGITPDPENGYSREILTVVGQVITLMDDIYDVHGTLEELELLTETFERWDINSLERLPEYMQCCFMTLFNFTNEFGYHILRDQGINVISNLRRMYVELSRAYYIEASWFHNGYLPTTNEYFDVAWVSVVGPVLLFYAYISSANPIDKKELLSFEQHTVTDLIRATSMVVRLTNDLGTAPYEMERGDVPKSVECVMNETGFSETEARAHVERLIETELKKMNKEMIMMEKEKPLKNIILSTCMNFARISLCYYQHGDGFGLSHSETNEYMESLVAQPIPIT